MRPSYSTSLRPCSSVVTSSGKTFCTSWAMTPMRGASFGILGRALAPLPGDSPQLRDLFGGCLVVCCHQLQVFDRIAMRLRRCTAEASDGLLEVLVRPPVALAFGVVVFVCANLA
jgi:hypothetical protein